MKAVKLLFGEHWLRRIGILLLIYIPVTFWPLVVFEKEFSFDKVKFTEEWIKTVISVSLIFLVLEYQKILFDTRRENVQLKSYLERDIANPIKAFLYTVQIEDNSPAHTSLIYQSWSKLFKELSETDLSGYITKFTNPDIRDFLSAFGITDLDKVIRETFTSRAVLNKQNIITILSIFINSLEKEIKSLK